MAERAEQLARLAADQFRRPGRFGDDFRLTRAESLMLQAAATGLIADCALGGDSDPAGAADWPPARTIRPAVLVWLCTDPQANSLVHADGVQVFAAVIDGPICLASSQVPFPLALLRCAVLGAIDLSDAQTAGLSFRGTRFRPARRDWPRLLAARRLAGRAFGRAIDLAQRCLSTIATAAGRASKLPCSSRLRGFTDDLSAHIRAAWAKWRMRN